MKKTTKIIISLAAAIVIAATVLTVSLITSSQKKDAEDSTKYSLQSTTLTTAPGTTVPPETESWVDLEQIANDLATATESDTATETIPVPSVSVAPQTTIVYVYVSEVTQAPATTQPKKPDNAPEMSEYRYTVNTETGTVTINRYLGSDSSIILPKEISGYPVTAIADKCFENSTVKAIGIQEGVTSIGKSAFKNCRKLETVSFLGVPYSVTVGDNAFEGCSKLKSINLPAAKSIGTEAFLGCSSLEKLTIRQGTETIGDSCFENCTALKEIVIPSSVCAIGTGVFNGHNEELVVRCVEGSVGHETANKYELHIDYITE